MLLLTFNIAEERYAIDTQSVIEIVPRIELKSVPMEENYIAGIFDYHGRYVPVIDIGKLCRDTALKDSLTTRIIIARLDDNSFIGILADNLTQTLRLSPGEFSSCGIKKLNAEFLGEITNDGDGLIQLVNIDQLLGTDVMTRLYEAAGTT